MNTKGYFLVGFMIALTLTVVSAGILEMVNNVCYGIRSMMPLVALTLFILLV